MSGFSYKYTPALFAPQDRGGNPPTYRKSVVGDVIIENDVAVRLKGGT